MTKSRTSGTATANATKTTKATKAPAVPASKRAPAATKPAATVKALPAEKRAAKTAAKPAPEARENREKVKKIKLVRDSFTMPEAEYAVLGEVKKACLKAGIEVKKSELLRVGVALIRQLDTARLKEILADLPTLKAGRPKKTK